ncbi:hypothetical protein RHMOL_Rhmol04G0216900 [Rhododendron molle]|uniref:Uncharacterized protein n=1 Tax=Rhododendron molle TaxID=49168 RepID=A0ACC0P2X2_RHOML|nr:hypothetical protein RHMOL_Rhmol04G0216900 [Rhododendron molle]
MCANGNPERLNHCAYTREPGAAEPRLFVLKLIFEMCANGNPERRNHCAYTREPGAAEPRLCVLKLIFEMCANGNPERQDHCAYTREPGAGKPRLGTRSSGTIMRVCVYSNGNPERRNHCEYVCVPWEPGAADHGEVWLGYLRRGANANCVLTREPGATEPLCVYAGTRSGGTEVVYVKTNF